jgi:alkylhydroperoxidase family enzyme
MHVRYAVARHQGLTEEKISQIDNLDSELFTPRERAALRFATAMVTNDDQEADEIFPELRRYFDEPQIVELGLTVMILHGINAFNNIFGIEPEAEIIVSQTGLTAHHRA